MKHRLLAIPFTSALLLAACGGQSTGGDVSPPAPTPTPTPTPSPTPTAPPATAEGLWQRPAGASTRAIAALVAKANASLISNYWLVYSDVNDALVPAGFIAGTGTSTQNSGSITDGSFVSPSSVELREYNFAGNPVAEGRINAVFSQKTSLNGSFQSVELNAPLLHPNQPVGSQTAANSAPADTTYFSCIPGATAATSGSDCAASIVGPTFTAGGVDWTINTTTPALSGTITFDAFKSHVDVFSGTYVANLFFAHNLLTISGTTTYNAGTRTLSIANALFDPTGSTAGVCTGAKLICSAVPTGQISGDVSLTFDDNTLTTYTGVAHTTQTTQGGQSTTTLNFHTVAGSTVIQSFTSAYVPAYETAATLSAVEGNHSGNAGVGTAQQPGTFNVTNGAVSGSESSGCTYTGTLTPNTTNNYFDVSLTFTGGGGCLYNAATFTGTAFIVNSQLTVTAVNTARDQGFIFVGQ